LGKSKKKEYIPDKILISNKMPAAGAISLWWLTAFVCERSKERSAVCSLVKEKKKIGFLHLHSSKAHYSLPSMLIFHISRPQAASSNPL
jgi:hypothetical protein